MAKATRAKPAPKPSPARRPGPKAFRPRVHVRMYCQGLGDCFLLRFEEARGKFFDVLIDCGIYKASPDATRIMNEVVDDVVATTGNRLDVLVVTHEHWDHMSGFAQALPKFQGMTIDQVWQAWTDDPDEPAADDLRAKYAKAKTALVGLLRQSQAVPGAAASPALRDAFQVMGFFGVDKDGDQEDDYGRVRALLAANSPRYLSPGEVVDVGKTGVRAFVLGPPKDVKAIGKDDPGKDGYQKQRAAFFGRFDAVLGAVGAGLDGAAEADRASRPFDARQEIPVEAARQSDFFQQMYPFDEPDHPEAFRSIDDLAYDALGGLALRLDSHINNLSLVLAFRLDDGRVLLFPGDAQAGNWKSWADPAKPLAFADAGLDARQLLADTVLYKVGHHGSHNATPKTYGLELMTRPDLLSFVPVDHEVADGAGYGEMPLVAILTELGKKTGGMVRSDKTDEAVKPFTPAEKKLTVQPRKGGPTVTRPLYYEVAFDL